MNMKTLLFCIALAFDGLCSAHAGHASLLPVGSQDYWIYWGIAPDGVTVLDSDDYAQVADRDGAILAVYKMPIIIGCQAAFMALSGP